MVELPKWTAERARGWISILAKERPATSDIHAVLRELDAAIATEARRAATVKQGAVHEGAGPEDIAHD